MYPNVFFKNSFRHQKSIDESLLNQTSNRNRRKPQALVKPNSRCIIQDNLKDIAIKSNDHENDDSSISSSYFNESNQLDPKIIPNLEDSEIGSYEPASPEQPDFQLSDNFSTFEPEAEEKNTETDPPAPSVKCKEEKTAQEENNLNEEDTFLR